LPRGKATLTHIQYVAHGVQWVGAFMPTSPSVLEMIGPTKIDG